MAEAPAKLRALARRIAPPVLADRGRAAAPLATLTPREREVLALMAEGRSNAAIAERLVVGAGAVEKHVASIFGKLGLAPTESDHRRVLAVLAWLRVTLARGDAAGGS